MKIDREGLLRKLEQVSPGLAKVKETVEQSSCFVFNNNRISTFNDEVFCTAEFPLDFSGAVHGRTLLSLLNKLSEQEIDCSLQNGELLIKATNSRSGIRAEADLLLPTGVEAPGEWLDLPPDFVDALEIVTSCAATEKTSFALTCVHITPDYLETCDNYQIARYPLETSISNCLVRSEALQHVIGLGASRLAESASWLHFATPSKTTLAVRKWKEEYPGLSPLMEVSGTKTVFPGGLAEAVAKAKIFADDNLEEGQLLVRLKKDKLRLRGQGAHGWYEEQRPIEYDGPELSFLIASKLLSEITKRTNECEIAEGRLKVNAGKFTYVACLGTVE